MNKNKRIIEHYTNKICSYCVSQIVYFVVFKWFQPLDIFTAGFGINSCRGFMHAVRIMDYGSRFLGRGTTH